MLGEVRGNRYHGHGIRVFLKKLGLKSGAKIRIGRNGRQLVAQLKGEPQQRVAHLISGR
ncbi:MAG: hypothetical protein JWO59_64 [Chloroflexi bacterium]|nr:hypothetical protein [Chloroflexota bacterium]